MIIRRLAALVAALALPVALGLSTAPAAAQQKITIGVSLAQDDNPFYIAMLRGIRARAQELGWEVATVSSNEDKLKQINGVQDLVAKGVKGILISPIDAVGVNAAYDAAAQAKVPIVSVARGCTSRWTRSRSAATSRNGPPRASAVPARSRCCSARAARQRFAISPKATPR
jgi:ribose transport system substrate-binding protein